MRKFFIFYLPELSVPFFIGLIFYSVFIYGFALWVLPLEQKSILNALKKTQTESEDYVKAIESASLPKVPQFRVVILYACTFSFYCGLTTWVLWQLLRSKIMWSHSYIVPLFISYALCGFISFILTTNLLKYIAVNSFNITEYKSFSGPFLTSMIMSGLVGVLICAFSFVIIDLYERRLILPRKI